MSRVTWASPAARDVHDIVDRLALESRAAALGFLDRVDQAVLKLTSVPGLGRIVPELERHNVRLYREIILSPWRVIYRCDRDHVYVLAVIDGRRNVEDILLRRLLRDET